MAKFDIEDLLVGLKTALIANLNTQIAAINTEKNDGITLKSVDSTAYHLQYPEDRTELSDPFIILEEADEARIDRQGPLTATVHQIGVHLILADNGTDGNIILRLWRYRRAMVDTILKNWASLVGSHKFEIARPSLPFKDMNTGWTGRAVGVVLQVTITE